MRAEHKPEPPNPAAEDPTWDSRPTPPDRRPVDSGAVTPVLREDRPAWEGEPPPPPGRAEPVRPKPPPTRASSSSRSPPRKISSGRTTVAAKIITIPRMISAARADDVAVGPDHEAEQHDHDEDGEVGVALRDEVGDRHRV